MSKIQKQNMTCESEGLRNWKEDQAKTKRKTVDGEFKGQKKWKKYQADAEKNEVDDEPKGLIVINIDVNSQLHWKQSPQENWSFKAKKHHQRNPKSDFLKHSNQNGDVQEQKNQKHDVFEQPTQKLGDVDEHPGQNSVVQEQSKQTCEPSNQDSDDDNEVVATVIRPGHIRFEPLGKAMVKINLRLLFHQETFHWNGITSKKKGQRWGKEDRSFTPRKEYNKSNNECSEILSNDKEKQPDAGVDFEKLPLLTSTPKEGDLVAYRILELSSTWTPEISSYRVGKVLWFKAESYQIMLVPVPEYPIVPEKADEDEGEAVQLDNALYKEDGSLEIDFLALIDVRAFKNGSPEPATEALNQSNEGSLGNGNTAKTVLPNSNDKQTVVPSSETGGENIWDELGEALSAKKEQLSKENGWGPWAKTPKKVQHTPPPPENSWGKNGKKVQPSPQSGWGKNAQKVQPSRDSSSGKQGTSGGKPWSYKGLRGGGLGSTMAMLRSKNDT
ncbi:coilin [Phtheirospermum japonicum]|uniref:Coilin n=1 Tax=Phtheirospermum japonicum TaxID=374723 RepID=A0A830CWA8_9LAMI|nr:coilin [Phtheirospermum japonicum]